MSDRPLLLIEVLVAEHERQAKMNDWPPLADPSSHFSSYEKLTEYCRDLEAEARKINGSEDEGPDDPRDEKDDLTVEQQEFFSKKTDELVKEFYALLHKRAKAGPLNPSPVKRAAVCFSGGGIRSATFGLGVMQGLARHAKLSGFHFLSTVSGGGYLGSWFTAWTHRRGLSEVEGALGTTATNSPLCPEPEPIRHLRSYSRYMSPRFSVLSADTWTLVGIYLRNLLLNWAVLIPLILGVLAIPRLAVSLVAWEKPWPWLPGAALLTSLLLGSWAVAYIVTNRPSLISSLKSKRGVASPYRREGWFLVLCLLPLLLSAMAASGFWAWCLNMNDGTNPNDIANSVTNGLKWWTSRFTFLNAASSLPMWLRFALFGTIFHVLGYLISRRWVREIGWADIAYSLITGFLGGALLYVMADEWFSSPLKSNPDASANAAFFACFAASAFLLTFLLVGVLFVGIGSYLMSDADREWMARAGAWILITIVVWGTVSALVILVPQFLLFENEYWGAKMKSLLASIGLGSGALTIFGGKSSGTEVNKAEDNKKKEEKGVAAKSLGIGMSLAAPLFAAFLLVLLSIISTMAIAKLCLELSEINPSGRVWCVFFSLTDEAKTFFTSLAPPKTIWQNIFTDPYHWQVLFHTPARTVFWAAAAVASLGVVMGFFININKFSLHSAYRDRLVRAYLGASRNSNERSPNPFTGLDEHDNLQMHDLLTDLYYGDSFKPGSLRNLVGKLAGTEPGGDYREVSALVWDQLPQRTKRLLQQYNADETTEQERKRLEPEVQLVLADGFNRLLQGPPLMYRSDLSSQNQAQIARVFDQVRGKFERLPEIEELLSQGSEAAAIQLKRLLVNRMILDQAYKDEVESLKESLEKPRPLHIINMALNLVGGADLAWQDRKAQSFTVSPLHAGSFNLGYRRSQEYAMTSKIIRRFISNRPVSAITLGTSLSISGAAASPNMGYHSSSVVTFLLALFNVRLGWWLGNPGKAGGQTYQMPSPGFAARPLVAETLGWTDAKHPYVYLSDGGHFENLGLYEMVMRRCHFIVVSDASADGDFNFEDLGNALRKIRIDMGVPIEFVGGITVKPPAKADKIFTNGGESGGHYCALAEINYRAFDGTDAVNGWLLYLKPTIYGFEPEDVLNYAKANKTFPHETTGDQMYSESQFESYRALGKYVIETVTDGDSGLSLEALIRKVCDYLGQKIPPELAEPKSQPQTVFVDIE